MNQAELEHALMSFDQMERSGALESLTGMSQAGLVSCEPETELFNMHCHSFFSFNAYGYSPAALAWLAKQRGYKLMGIVDFDGLDGVSEFLDACELVGVRGSAGIETRVFVPDYASVEMNSPGEPGVCYHLGIGFTTSRIPNAARPILTDLQDRAARRNLGILSRVNDYLAPVTVDYERDVLPLTPGGRPTERHMVVAYAQAAERTLVNPAGFWAEKTLTPVDEMAEIMADPPRLQNLLRAKLMKRGGVGYVQPESGMFPSLDAVNEFICACGALPCVGWLDGESPAEQALDDWLDYHIARGAVAVNIVPDRNWNVADPDLRRVKLDRLYQVVEIARELDLPLNIGTEMNSFGQRLVDDLEAAELAPVRQTFQDGAYFVFGQTILQRALGIGYQSEWAAEYLPGRAERNAFYTQVGYDLPPGRASMARLRACTPDLSPQELRSELGKDGIGND